MNARLNHRLTYKSALLFAGVIALSQSGIYSAQANGNSITSVSSAGCSETSGYTLTLAGSFPSPIINIWANSIQIPTTDWSQSPTNVVVKVPATSFKTFTVDTYDGGPVISKDFTCTEVVVPVVEAPVVTESGGVLPTTGTNNYNYLAGGLGLALVGSAGLLRRRPVKN